LDYSKFSDKHLLALARIAKQKRGGVYVFFKNPYTMISLRDEIELRGI